MVRLRFAPRPAPARPPSPLLLVHRHGGDKRVNVALEPELTASGPPLDVGKTALRAALTRRPTVAPRDALPSTPPEELHVARLAAERVPAEYREHVLRPAAAARAMLRPLPFRVTSFARGPCRPFPVPSEAIPDTTLSTRPSRLRRQHHPTVLGLPCTPSDLTTAIASPGGGPTRGGSLPRRSTRAGPTTTTTPPSFSRGRPS